MIAGYLSARPGRILLAGLAVGITACGGSGNNPLAVDENAACIPSDTSAATECGRVIVALTDAEGGFASYAVDVRSITLERDDGSMVEILPQSARIDFAQLTTLSEVVAAAAIAPGQFVGGRIRIDYAESEIYVDTGGAIVPAEVYDRRGTLLSAPTAASVVEIEITLPQPERLIVARNRTSLVSIDFDLAASHVVDTSTDPVTVVAAPYLVAEVRPVDNKETRVRGALIDVDPDGGTYEIALRPWMHRLGDYGTFTVITGEATEFEIDGTAHVGQSGLAALADMPQGTVTVAFGTLDLDDRRFVAEVVHAGDSVGGGGGGPRRGHIVARNGNELRMLGATVIRRDRPAHFFHRTIVVGVGPGTGVSRVGDPGGVYDAGDLSVGQRAMIFGQFADPAPDAGDGIGDDVRLVLDATEGRARMLGTSLLGTVNELLAGQVNIELKAVDHLSASLFDFTGTGRSAADDADPRSYEIALSGTDPEIPILLESLEIDKPLRANGFVAPFGQAPPDFEGHVVIGHHELPAAIVVAWGVEGTAAPFSVMGSAGLVVDLENPELGQRHHLLIGDRLIDLLDLPASPSISATDTSRVYGIAERDHAELFREFGDFVEALALRLSSGERARSLAAYGRYDEAAIDLTANKVVVHMLSPASLQ